MDKKLQVYAVIRLDVYDGEFSYNNISFSLTVKEVLPTLEEAVQEVERLNKLKQRQGSTVLLAGNTILSRWEGARNCFD